MQTPPPSLAAYETITYPDKGPQLTRHICGRLAQLYGDHPLMRWFVHRYVVTTDPHDPEHVARSIWQFARDHWPYTQEPGEQILTPGRVLLGWPSDCDDRTAVICAMLEALRIRPWGISLIGRTAAGELVDLDDDPAAVAFHIVPWVAIDGRQVFLETCDRRTRWAEHPIEFLQRVSREDADANTIVLDRPPERPREPVASNTALETGMNLGAIGPHLGSPRLVGRPQRPGRIAADVNGWFDDLKDGAKYIYETAVGADRNNQPPPSQLPYYPPPQNDNTMLILGGAAILVVVLLMNK